MDSLVLTALLRLLKTENLTFRNIIVNNIMEFVKIYNMSMIKLHFQVPFRYLNVNPKKTSDSAGNQPDKTQPKNTLAAKQQRTGQD
ncbi:hypothetical protein D3C80_2114060 [compost metagenome]